MRKASPLPLPAYPTPSSPWAGNTSPSPGDAGTPGRSSAVIARLTADNDRLKREIKAERAAKEEALQQFQALKGRVNMLEEQNGTLAMQCDANASTLNRKERRLDDLKTQLDVEVARRQEAENRQAEMGRKLGDLRAETSREVSQANGARQVAEAGYNTLAKDYFALKKKAEAAQKQLAAAYKAIDEKVASAEKYTVVADQIRQSGEKNDQLVVEMKATIDSYHQTDDQMKQAYLVRIAELERAHFEKQAEIDRLHADMLETRDRMNWVMGLHKARQQPQ
ncbi:hypothetical protein EJ06DRAFT_556783 [Trichodelitschia bisporula]|uniref:SWI5-dependent HO expression protein 3 n=1 Tax=Trichodelitschia bisporula TaxID=703511 RepID=A0A6G1HWP8_9PEZI|nr:hypothetical protein EJ06DRAFT_556783 [Trichodelitschia bisporula]